jgi:triosephosphate isomerase (TIM)
MAARKPLIAGNWKMFGRRADLAEVAALTGLVGSAAASVDVLICPPTPYIEAACAAAKAGGVLVGAQDCGAVAEDGARTGEVNASMLADAGARYVIVGHSERRSQHGESSGLVRRKAEAAQAAGLIPIICVGETLAERDTGRVAEIVGGQVDESVPSEGGVFVIAYEPVWAIGGDRTPTPTEIAEVHALIRETLERRFGEGANATRVLYGGSVGPNNADEIFSAEGVDGALVGRASLKSRDFAAIVLAHPAVT